MKAAYPNTLARTVRSFFGEYLVERKRSMNCVLESLAER